MSRPVDKKYKTSLWFGTAYPDSLKWITKSGRHEGTDIACPTGTEVRAGVNGKLYGKQFYRGFGNTVIIEFLYYGVAHKFYLAHLSEFITKKQIGDKINKTEIVALSGNTGTSTGSHLHCECRKRQPDGSWVAIDPSFIIGG